MAHRRWQHALPPEPKRVDRGMAAALPFDVQRMVVQDHLAFVEQRRPATLARQMVGQRATEHVRCRRECRQAFGRIGADEEPAVAGKQAQTGFGEHRFQRGVDGLDFGDGNRQRIPGHQPRVAHLHLQMHRIGQQPLSIGGIALRGLPAQRRQRPAGRHAMEMPLQLCTLPCLAGLLPEAAGVARECGRERLTGETAPFRQQQDARAGRHVSRGNGPR